jgi:hypothetical protein
MAIGVAVAAIGVVGCGTRAYAHNQPAENTVNEIAELVDQDENADTHDLNVSPPRILPTNALYVFKDLSRGLRTLLAASSLKRAELALQFTDELLIEIQGVSARTKDPNVLKPVLEHYQAGISRLRELAGNMRLDSAGAVSDFLTQLIGRQLKYYAFLGKLEKEVPPEAFGALKHAKEEVIETIVGVPLEFENPESFRKRLEAALASRDGSRFKDFKNLEIIKAVKDKAADQTSDALERAEETFVKRFLGLSMEDLRGFESYTAEIGGNEALHLAVLADIERREFPETIRTVFEEARSQTLRRIEKRLMEFRDDAEKQEYIGHLADGSFESILLLEELEEEMGPGARDTVLEVKAVSLAEFKRALLRADTSKKRERLLREVERLRDEKTPDALRTIEEITPEDDRELLTQMQSRAAERSREDGDRVNSGTTPRNEIPFERIIAEEQEMGAARGEALLILQDIEKLAEEKEFKDAKPDALYQALLREAKEKLKESDTARALLAAQDARYVLKSRALYPLLLKNKVPNFMSLQTQRALASIFSDLTRKNCGEPYPLITVPLTCKNGQWQRYHQ